MFTLSGFADEIDPQFDVQLATLTSLRIRFLELRGAWGKGVMAFDADELARLQSGMAASGIRVSAIGSPIGKIKIDDPFEPHLQAFEHALELAALFGCPYIRMFSFFVPEGEAARHRPEVMRRLRALLDVARGHPVTLLHENERHIYGDTPERCLDIFETLASPQLRMTFDPANFVMCGVRPYDQAFALLGDYVTYMHIKDGCMADQRVTPAGQGDGQVREILAALHDRSYDGYLSLEPHLAVAGEFSGFSGPDRFATATQALRGLLRDIGATEG
jgi:sugar phosphate isomerase/epimerase